ncbi:hypothetical protein CDAR_290831 [Caerostris darwini]|uniref:Uncharacterized protein n=1 Tax=Caerostris darwini TaxID=1538125 RepID=A0AAV4VN06_9ARAC|nr:hypothetical protein CDAR_290831 [Caerostris darwini]
MQTHLDRATVALRTKLTGYLNIETKFVRIPEMIVRGPVSSRNDTIFTEYHHHVEVVIFGVNQSIQQFFVLESASEDCNLCLLIFIDGDTCPLEYLAPKQQL